MMKYYLILLLALSFPSAADALVAQEKSPSGGSAVAPPKAPDAQEPKAPDAQEPKAGEMPEAPAEPRSSRSRMRIDSRNLRTSPAMRALFREVLEEPSCSVVEVFADGKRVCLGTVVSSDGHIATKASLAKGNVTCRLRDVKDPVSAAIVGADKDYDLAILKIDRNDLTPIQWTSKEYDLGSFVASPSLNGDAHSIGVMSVERRRFSLRQPQPSDAAQQRGYLGVMPVAAGDSGVRLQQVVQNSGAAAAGLKRNDLLVRVNDKELKQPQELFNLLSKMKPKDKVKVEVKRGDETLDFTVTLGTLPSGSRSPMDRWGGGPFSERRFSFPAVLAHDSVVAPNNVGGPLVDSHGNVIGLNVSRALRVTTYAIAANDVERIVDKFTKLDASPSVEPAPDPVVSADKIRASGIDGTVLMGGQGATGDKVFQSFIRYAGGRDAQVVVLQSGGGNEDDLLRLVKQWSQSEGTSVSVLRAGEPRQRERMIEMLSTANAVWIDAATPESLAPLSSETAITESIRAVLERDGIVGGAGWFSEVFGSQGLGTTKSEAALIPQSVVTASTSVDAHPSKTLARNPETLSIRLAPNAAVVCRGRRLMSIGDGDVSIQLAATKSHPEPKELQLTGRSRMADLTALRRQAMQRTKPVFPPAKVGEPKVAAGSLMIVGGGGMPRGAIGRFVKAAGGKEAKIVVIPISTPEPLPERDRMAQTLQRAGAAKVTVLRGRTPDAVDEAASLEALREATGIWFGGGRQWRFVDAYEGTQAYELMHDVLKRGGIIAGSSAGASIQGEYLARGNPLGSNTMMAAGYERGFSFLPGVAIDQHFSQRKRFGDLKSLVTRYPQFLGIGIDESTAIVVTGQIAEVIGRTRVCFYDGVSEGDFTSVEAGQRYDLVARKVLTSDDEKE